MVFIILEGTLQQVVSFKMLLVGFLKVETDSFS